MNHIKDLVDKQKAFFYSGATHSYSFRIKKLKALKKAIKEYEQRYFDALRADFNKPEFESFVSETGYLIKDIEHTITHLHTWMEPEKVGGNILSFPSRSAVYREPYGVSLVISPWNYPVQLALAPAIASIAAGNTVILKPSEHAPATASVLLEMINKEFDDAFFGVVLGEVEETTALLQEPLDYVFFTGSPQVGKIIMKQCAEQLIPNTLELGGKSPCIVDKSANIKLAAKRIVQGKYFNAGQTCIAPDYVLVDEGVKDKFLDEAKNSIKQFYGDSPRQSDDYARIIHQNHFNKIKSYLEEGDVVVGGEFDANEKYISPTVLTNIREGASVMEEEIFGPVLPVIGYKDEAEIVPYIRRHSKPLALYHFTKNTKLKKELRQQLSFGGGMVNDTLEHLINQNLPFGGVGTSGIGSYHGKFGFEAFSHRKAMLEKPSWIDVPLKYPPYGGKLSLIRKLFKIS